MVSDFFHVLNTRDIMPIKPYTKNYTLRDNKICLSTKDTTNSSTVRCEAIRIAQSRMINGIPSVAAGLASITPIAIRTY